MKYTQACASTRHNIFRGIYLYHNNLPLHITAVPQCKPGVKPILQIALHLLTYSSLLSTKKLSTLAPHPQPTPLAPHSSIETLSHNPSHTPSKVSLPTLPTSSDQPFRDIHSTSTPNPLKELLLLNFPTFSTHTSQGKDNPKPFKVMDTLSPPKRCYLY